MHPAVAALLDQRSGIEQETWRSFWDQLTGGDLDRGEAVALLTSLATRLPDHDSLRNMLASLNERREPVTVSWPGSVNIVGTGGGPKTFNISTASAFVAASMGVKVVKTGSRAYTSSVGSVDLLDRLGVTLTRSYRHTEDTLDRHGIAFAGPFVYPAELTRLARSIMPMSLKPFGRFLNAFGPFLAALPVTAQVTGVSVHAPQAELRRLAAGIRDRRIWLCTNDSGADELLGFADNVVYTNDETTMIRLWAGRFTSDAGTFEDLAPAKDLDSVVEHFLSVISGEAGTIATDTIALNAASLAVATGTIEDWPTAIETARQAVRGGATRALVDSMRAPAERKLSLVKKAAREDVAANG
jgi:anthranilate phosphoribosyltransferase